jgi:hypothetical protein
VIREERENPPTDVAAPDEIGAILEDDDLIDDIAAGEDPPGWLEERLRAWRDEGRGNG